MKRVFIDYEHIWAVSLGKEDGYPRALLQKGTYSGKLNSPSGHLEKHHNTQDIEFLELPLCKIFKSPNSFYFSELEPSVTLGIFKSVLTYIILVKMDWRKGSSSNQLKACRGGGKPWTFSMIPTTQFRNAIPLCIITQREIHLVRASGAYIHHYFSWKMNS